MAEVTIGDRNVTLTVEQLRQRYNLDDIASTKLTVSQINGVLNETNAELSNFVTQVTEDIADLQSQVDGTITSWFYSGTPTLENAPASDWLENEYESHRGDLYYDQNTGYAYRFSYVDSVYQWVQLQDTDATLALSIANEAKDTADSKRRTFVTTPTPPYDIGDIWFGNDMSDLKRCQAPKTAEQSYDSADWIKAVKYTDDSTFDIVISKINDSEEVETIDNEKLSTITADKIALEGYTTINDGFSVDLTGNMKATNADVAGKITSNEGAIGGWNISSSGIANGSTNATAKGILSGDTIAFYAGHLTPSSAPFRVTQAGSLVANNATISGTINSSAINSSYFDVTTSGYLRYYKNPGFFVCGSITDHPYASALNLSKGTGNGIVFNSGTEYNSIGSPIGHISMNSDSMYVYADNAININAGGNTAVTSSTSSTSNYVRMNSVYSSHSSSYDWVAFGAAAGSSPARIRSDGNHMWLFAASGGSLYAGGTTDGYKIKTDSYTPSSLNVKKNLTNMKNKYDELYKEIQSVNSYDYDYKYKGIEKNDKGYGFIIDEIESTKLLKNYFINYDVKKEVTNDNKIVDINPDGPIPNNTIDVKVWSTDAYVKGLFVMIKTLQEKIDTLENRIEKLERGE